MRCISTTARALAVATSVAMAACAEDDPFAGGVDPHSEAEVVAQIGRATEVRAVDILVVVEDSSTMAQEQANVARTFAQLIGVLDNPNVRASYRIGVTTTDVGNPNCDDATAERGAFIASSCRSRVGDFVTDEGIDHAALGCTDHCTRDALAILPTTTALDPVPTPRPWIERIDCVSNVADDAMADASACIGPQGVAGCNFESPLEAMYQALLRTMTVGDPQYGFLRDHATLFVLFLTDGTDCSYRQEYERIFLPADVGGSPVFWSDPTADAPTRAACWNAGVRCEGDGMPYDECVPTNAGVDGTLGVPDDMAVLHPVQRYIDLLRQIEDSKHGIADDPAVVVSLVSGVALGGDGEVVYSRSPDPVDQAEHGIGVGCTYDDNDPATPMLTAHPPVREKAVADAFGASRRQAVHSTCQESYTDTLAPVLPTLRDIIVPTCMPACVADTDEDTVGLQPRCTLREETPDLASGEVLAHDILPCGADDSLPDGADACFVALVDDEISEHCESSGWNLEFQIRRSEDACRRDDTQIFATCSASLDTLVDCPGRP
jgi:hypothetical protein